MREKKERQMSERGKREIEETEKKGKRETERWNRKRKRDYFTGVLVVVAATLFFRVRPSG